MEVDVLVGDMYCYMQYTQLTVLLLEKWLKFVFQLSNSSFLLLIFSKHFTYGLKYRSSFDFDDFHSCSTVTCIYGPLLFEKRLKFVFPLNLSSILLFIFKNVHTLFK